MKKLDALVKSINQLFVGANYTTQSTLTYVYGFFEGALVLISLFLYFCKFIIWNACYDGVFNWFRYCYISYVSTHYNSRRSCYSCSCIQFTSIFWIFVAVSLGFFCMFIAVVAVMILYKGFLKEVFGIDVDDRKTKTPDNPF